MINRCFECSGEVWCRDNTDVGHARPGRVLYPTHLSIPGADYALPIDQCPTRIKILEAKDQTPWWKWLFVGESERRAAMELMDAPTEVNAVSVLVLLNPDIRNF